jgi:hypothetical protein
MQETHETQSLVIEALKFGFDRNSCNVVGSLLEKFHREMELVEGKKPAFTTTTAAWNAVVKQLKDTEIPIVSQWADNILLPYMKSKYIRLGGLCPFLGNLGFTFSRSIDHMNSHT